MSFENFDRKQNSPVLKFTQKEVNIRDRKMPLIRFCHPHNYKDIYEFDEERYTFTGPVGLITNDAINSYKEFFRQRVANSTLEIHYNRGIGELDTNTHKFTGCLGEIQSNVSDFILMLWEYPFDGINISSGLIAYETNLVIGGMYDQETIGDAIQMLDLFAFFSPLVWFNCLLAVMSIFLILKIHEVISPPNRIPCRNILFKVLAHCSNFGSMPAGGITRCLLFMLASLFSLIVIGYLCSSISTQLVMIKQPLVFHTYDDIMNRGALPFFIRGMAYDQFFKKPSASALRKKFWRYATTTFDLEDLYVDIDPIALLLCAMKLVLRQAVFIMEAPLMPVLPGSGCPVAQFDADRIRDTAALIQDHKRLKPLMTGLNFGAEQQKFILDFTRKNPMNFSAVPDFNFHIATDPGEEKFSQSILMAENSDPIIRQGLTKASRYLIETGYPIKTMRRVVRYNLLAGNAMIPTLLGTPNKARKYKVENCFSESVLLPEAHVETVSFENLWSLVVSVGSIYGIIGVIVVVENIVSYRTQKTRCSPKKKLVAPTTSMIVALGGRRTPRPPPFFPPEYLGPGPPHVRFRPYSIVR